jgi:outer membrane lipoprotein
MPRSIRLPEPAPLTVREARAAPERHAGTPVRWGGNILHIENAADTTDVELLARALDATGAPRMDAEPQGRFIARFTGFLDPAEYPRERLLTVTGVLAGAETRDVGEYPYRYPVVRATGKHLWPEPEPVVYGPWYPEPWYDPWHPPWWGPGPGPWYRPWYW